MSKLKRAFTILLCILLTLPMCLVSKPNNVYAAVGGTITNNQIDNVCAQVFPNIGNSWTEASDSAESSNYNLNSYSKVSFNVVIALKKINTDMSRGRASYTCKMIDVNSGTVLQTATKTIQYPNCIRVEDAIEWDIAALRQSGYDTSNVKFTFYCSAGANLENYAWACVPNTAMTFTTNPTPVFNTNSYVQSNGNLTRPCAYIVFL